MNPSPTLPRQADLPSTHSLEMRIRHDLMAVPELRFSSLVVHRIPDGVCLEGVVTTTAEEAAVSQLVKQVAGVGEVLNHLVICPEAEPK